MDSPVRRRISSSSQASTSTPLRMNTAQSARASISSTRWLDSSISLSSAAASRMQARISSRASRSMPLKGSSSSQTFARRAMVTAILSLASMPEDISFTFSSGVSSIRSSRSAKRSAS